MKHPGGSTGCTHGEYFQTVSLLCDAVAFHVKHPEPGPLDLILRERLRAAGNGWLFRFT
jgi:hypothetical protein